jgi:hypothetical protein
MKMLKKRQLEGVVVELLEYLPERSQKILIKRFGLYNKKIYTLDSIGKEFGVSRERIRQIEVSSFNFLKKIKKSKKINEVFDFVYYSLQNEGGFLDRRSFKEILFGQKMDLIQKNQLAFLFNSLPKLYYQKDTVSFGGIWYFASKKNEVKKLNNLHEKFVKYFEETGLVMKFEELKALTRTDIFTKKDKEFFQGETGTKRLKIILKGSKLIGKNIVNEWGLLSWNIIAQKYVKEKAFLILKKYKKPLHFRELTEYMNKNWRDKKTLPQTVHNVIIKYEEFVFVEPGTYTIKEKWIY